MAISKTVINAALYDSWTSVANVLRAKLVTDMGVATTVTADSNLVVSATGLTITFTYTPGNLTYSVAVENGSLSETWTAGGTMGILRTIICGTNGVIMDFVYTNSGAHSAIIFTKNNENKLAMIWTLPSNSGYDMYMTGTAVGDSYVQADTITFSISLSTVQKAALVQTSLTPFLFWPAEGSVSYAPNALYSLRPVDISDKFGDYILGSYHYISNGMLWLKDDPV